MSSYRGSFGFNAKIQRILKKKTSIMEPFKCHGGLVIDEMKLSENLSVETAEKAAGFVDFVDTVKKDKRLLFDQSLVVIISASRGEQDSSFRHVFH